MTDPAPNLVDRFGRVVTDLRVSLTDRCNFRCRYCMPADGLDWMAPATLLTFDEILRVVGLLVDHGVQSVKLTGGEPLLRGRVTDLVRALRGAHPQLDLSMTTNGSLLERHAAALADAGLNRVTVSCDSLATHRFEAMTLRDQLDSVLRGLRAAADHGLTPIKVNTVVIRGENDEDIESFAELARETGYDVRFIEYMPLDAQAEWRAEHVVTGAEILERIVARWPLDAVGNPASDPATSYRFRDGAAGSIGIIPSVSAAFCANCDRLRLTADGKLRACLFSLGETDLRGPLRLGADDERIGELARDCVAGKWAGHRIGQDDFEQPARPMSSIGG